MERVKTQRNRIKPLTYKMLKANFVKNEPIYFLADSIKTLEKQKVCLCVKLLTRLESGDCGRKCKMPLEPLESTTGLKLIFSNAKIAQFFVNVFCYSIKQIIGIGQKPNLK